MRHGRMWWAAWVSRVRQGFVLDAPTVLVMAYFMLGEVPSLPTLLGGAVVMGGVLVAQLFSRMPSRRKKHSANSDIPIVEEP